jgi:hypothetical protein
MAATDHTQLPAFAWTQNRCQFCTRVATLGILQWSPSPWDKVRRKSLRHICISAPDLQDLLRNTHGNYVLEDAKVCSRTTTSRVESAISVNEDYLWPTLHWQLLQKCTKSWHFPEG